MCIKEIERNIKHTKRQEKKLRTPEQNELSAGYLFVGHIGKEKSALLFLQERRQKSVQDEAAGEPEAANRERGDKACFSFHTSALPLFFYITQLVFLRNRKGNRVLQSSFIQVLQ